MEAVEIKVTGRVQGVGFRYFAQSVANPIGLVGWVKNMSDGSVLIRAAGSPQQLEQFRSALREGPSYGRTDALVEHYLAGNALADFERFQVTY